jgi:hypothetical protein
MTPSPTYSTQVRHTPVLYSTQVPTVNPIATLVTPYSTLGMALMYLLYKDLVLILPPSIRKGARHMVGFDSLFKDGTTLSSAARLPIRKLGTLLSPGKKIATAVVTGFRVKIDF